MSNQWGNPNSSIFRIRIMEKKYAESFLKQGNILLGTPQSWVSYAEKYGEGRGDRLEGTLFFCDIHNMNKIVEMNNKYNSTHLLFERKGCVKPQIINHRVVFKDKRTMKLPCYCFYVIKVGDFELPKSTGKCELEVKIDGSYFKDFVDNKSYDEICKLPDEKKPVLIIISDFEKFKIRLVNALNNIGIKEKDILLEYIRYVDFNKLGDDGYIDILRSFPYELFVKDKRFEKQREGRFIVKTTDEVILEKLKYPIELGNLEDIASIHYGYYPEGITIKLDVNIEEKI